MTWTKGPEEVIEKGHELWWLLDLFSYSLPEIWQRTPSRMDPVWVDIGDFEIDSDRPLEILTMILVSTLGGGVRFSLEEKELEMLYELWVTMEHFMFDSYDVLFLKPDHLCRAGKLGQAEDSVRLHEVFEIWKVVGRLCRAVLEMPAVARWRNERVSFTKIFARHTMPLHVTPRVRPVANPPERTIMPFGSSLDQSVRDLSALLEFFSLPYDEMWLRLLEEVPQASADRSIETLASLATLLVRRGDDWLRQSRCEATGVAEGETARALRELAALLYWFVLNHRRDAMELPDDDLLEPRFVIWRVARRLSESALLGGGLPLGGLEDVSVAELIEAGRSTPNRH